MMKKFFAILALVTTVFASCRKDDGTSYTATFSMNKVQ